MPPPLVLPPPALPVVPEPPPPDVVASGPTHWPPSQTSLPGQSESSLQSVDPESPPPPEELEHAAMTPDPRKQIDKRRDADFARMMNGLRGLRGLRNSGQRVD